MLVPQSIEARIYKNQHAICDRIIAQNGLRSKDLNPNNREWHAIKLPKNQEAYRSMFAAITLELVRKFEPLFILDLACGIPYYWSEAIRSFHVERIVGLDLFEPEEIFSLCQFREDELLHIHYEKLDLNNIEAINQFVSKPTGPFNFFFNHCAHQHHFTPSLLGSSLTNPHLIVKSCGGIIEEVRRID